MTATVAPLRQIDRVASQVEKTKADLIIIIEDHVHYSNVITAYLRKEKKLDQTPIFVVKNRQETTKLIQSLGNEAL